jgi:beta-alanine--pyruvate transaminase
MFATVDVHPDGGPGQARHIFQKKLFANGLNLKTTGDSAIIAPPLIAEKKHVDEIADILRRTLKAL